MLHSPPSMVSETSDGVLNDVENEESGVFCAYYSPTSTLVLVGVRRP